MTSSKADRYISVSRISVKHCANSNVLIFFDKAFMTASLSSAIETSATL